MHDIFVYKKFYIFDFVENYNIEFFFIISSWINVTAHNKLNTQ